MQFFIGKVASLLTWKGVLNSIKIAVIRILGVQSSFVKPNVVLTV